MVIIFSSEKARNFLLENGFVFTIRGKRRTMLGKDWMTDKRTGKKISDVYIDEVGLKRIHGLKPFVENSGFKTLKGWIDEITVLNWGKGVIGNIDENTSGWLYKVTVISESIVCGVCKKDIPEKDRNFALYPEYHPGYLGPIHPDCYAKMVEEIPDLPWTDPISGQVDYREMAESLGVSDPDEDMDFEEDYY